MAAGWSKGKRSYYLYYKARTIPFTNSKGKHYRIFLLKDNHNFLPPKEMLECQKYVIEEKDGQAWEVPLLWYQIQEDPAAYLADYDITKYLNFTKTIDEWENNEKDTYT